MVSVYDVDVACESCNETVCLDPPARRYRQGAVAASLLGLLGFGAGLTIGVATAGFGITAAPFMLAIGLYAGYRAGLWVAAKRDGVTCPECGHDYS